MRNSALRTEDWAGQCGRERVGDKQFGRSRYLWGACEGARSGSASHQHLAPATINAVRRGRCAGGPLPLDGLAVPGEAGGRLERGPAELNVPAGRRRMGRRQGQGRARAAASTARVGSGSATAGRQAGARRAQARCLPPGNLRFLLHELTNRSGSSGTCQPQAPPPSLQRRRRRRPAAGCTCRSARRGRRCGPAVEGREEGVRLVRCLLPALACLPLRTRGEGTAEGAGVRRLLTSAA